MIPPHSWMKNRRKKRIPFPFATPGKKRRKKHDGLSDLGLRSTRFRCPKQKRRRKAEGDTMGIKGVFSEERGNQALPPPPLDLAKALPLPVVFIPFTDLTPLPSPPSFIANSQF